MFIDRRYRVNGHKDVYIHAYNARAFRCAGYVIDKQYYVHNWFSQGQTHYKGKIEGWYSKPRPYTLNPLLVPQFKRLKKKFR